MTVMVKILFGQIGAKGNQMIGEMEKIAPEAIKDMEENGMMTIVIQNIQSYVKSQVYLLTNLINMITRKGT